MTLLAKLVTTVHPRIFLTLYRIMNISFTSLTVAIAMLLSVSASLFAPLQACESCALYSPAGWDLYIDQVDMIDGYKNSPEQEIANAPNPTCWRFNFFTRHAELDQRIDGTRKSDNMGEELDSFIHQLSLSYAPSSRFSLHLNLPYYDREYTRLESGSLTRDKESGFGDLSAYVRLPVFRSSNRDRRFKVTAIVGVKAPTGNTDRLREDHDHGGHSRSSSHDSHDSDAGHNSHDEDTHMEGEHEDGDSHSDAEPSSHDHDEHRTHDADEHSTHSDEHSSSKEMTHSGHMDTAAESSGHAHSDESAIHAHQLALGSGSWDAIVGLRADYEQGLWFADAMALGYIRTEGDHDYHYADDLYLSSHVGRVLHRTPVSELRLRGGILGEFRDADEQGGVSIDHSEFTAYYAQGTLIYSAGALSGELGIDLPIEQESGAPSLVPESRIRASFGVNF